jgi:hypothetical protein
MEKAVKTVKAAPGGEAVKSLDPVGGFDKNKCTFGV